MNCLRLMQLILIIKHFFQFRIKQPWLWLFEQLSQLFENLAWDEGIITACFRSQVLLSESSCWWFCLFESWLWTAKSSVQFDCAKQISWWWWWGKTAWVKITNIGNEYKNICCYFFYHNANIQIFIGCILFLKIIMQN